MSAPKKAQSDSVQALPDFSGDWSIYGKPESDAELEARFFFEFARESATALRLMRELGNWTRGEILRGTRRALLKPLNGLCALHPCLHRLALALAPVPDLPSVSWKTLDVERKKRVIRDFTSPTAFRSLGWPELLEFRDELMRFKEPQTELSESHPKWHGSSQFYWDGIERAVVFIDWSLGPQAVKRAMNEWFQKRKGELPELALKGFLPGKKPAALFYFKTKDKEGASHPRQKYLVALRGLGAMRLLSRHTLAEAVTLSENGAGKSTYAKPPGNLPAWEKGMESARRTFHETFYRQGEPSLNWRKIEKLPATEEPISYQRWLHSKQ